MTTIDAPNLDAQDTSTLTLLAAVFDTLAEYSRAKKRAMEFRQAGNITRATQLEGYCEILYRQLPEGYRW